jgi:IS1 family transposase
LVVCLQQGKERPANKEGYGDVWTWTALDADSKLVVSYMLGSRDAGYANAFMQDVADRLTHRVQLTTDGLKSYLDAVYKAFENDIDYAVLNKIYGSANPGSGRYSPAPCIGVKSEVHCGWPERKHVSTSFIERQNLTMRMSMRRFTRLTNAFSKKIENHAHAVAIYTVHYNFCRKHITLDGKTPAMAAGLADHVWTIEEMVGLLDYVSTSV